jgi:hypothetical protein
MEAPWMDCKNKEPKRMHDIFTYHIEVRDELDEEAFNATSPLQVTVEWVDAAATRFTVYADQSGLIGLLRHLHRQGFVILAVLRE